MSNLEKYLALNTTPITNIVQRDFGLMELYCKQYQEVCAMVPYTGTYASLKAWYSNRMGSPTYGITSGKHICVWEIDGGSVMLLSKRGMSFEVKQNSTPQEAYDSWVALYVFLINGGL